MTRQDPYECPAFTELTSKLKERNACTVVALWAVTQRPLDQCFEWMRIHGREHRQGMSWLEIDKALSSMKKFRIKKGPYTRQNRITLGQFIKKHSVGKYYVLCRGHALAVIDGVVHDHTDGLRRQVTMAYRVYDANELNRGKRIN